MDRSLKDHFNAAGSAPPISGGIQMFGSRAAALAKLAGDGFSRLVAASAGLFSALFIQKLPPDRPISLSMPVCVVNSQRAPPDTARL